MGLNNVKTLDVLAKAEGTDKSGGKDFNKKQRSYDITIGYGIYDKGASHLPPPSNSTINQVLERQEIIWQYQKDNGIGFPDGKGNRYPSTATGRYQYTMTTIRSALEQPEFADVKPETQKFDAQFQDRLANYHLNKMRKNSSNTNELQNKVKGKWDSIPGTDGKTLTQYTGPGTSQDNIRSALEFDAQAGIQEVPAQSAADLNIIGADGRTGLERSRQIGAPLDENGNLIIQPEQIGPNPDEWEDPITGRGQTADGTSIFNTVFDPKPNPFKEFSTMTYGISLYLMSSQQYIDMMELGSKKLNGFTLFVQSGGAQNSGQEDLYGARRSKYFHNDFYIDDVKFVSLISGTASMAAHNTFTIDFTITEPSGITFFENMNAMVRNESIGEKKNYTAQTYLMVIRFYGYDENGNQIKGSTLSNEGKKNSDPNAFSEKFIPFIFTGIKFRLQADKVVYQCSTVCPQSSISKDKVHSVIDSQKTITGKTLDLVLRRNTADTLGLMQAMNEQSISYTKSNSYKYADEYEIKWTKEFDNIKVLSSDMPYPQISSMKINQTNTNIIFDNGIIKADIKNRTFALTAGTSIIKIIEAIIQTSSYVTNQLKQFKDGTGKIDVRQINSTNFVWFKINTEVQQIYWDDNRNDYAYKIIYVIKPYQFISESEYARKEINECISVHKSYDFWFTGLNTEVLEFYQDYDFMWYSSISQDYSTDDRSTRYENNLGNINTLKSIKKVYVEPSQPGASQTGTNNNTDIQQNIASSLYSPADQAMAKITIIGDPDFISQSELFYSPSYMLEAGAKYSNKPYLEDGSVNYDTSEIYFTINYNTVVDYDLSTGLANIKPTYMGDGQSAGRAGEIRHSLVYRANIITTELGKGKFTQVLEGTMKEISVNCRKDIEYPSDTRLEPENLRSTPSQYNIDNTANIHIPSATRINEYTKINERAKFPGDISKENKEEASDENLNTETKFKTNRTDVIEDYVNSDTNNFNANTGEVSSITLPTVDDAVNYYTKANKKLTNIFTDSYASTSRFTQGVWTNVEGIFTGDANNDDNEES